MRNQSVLISGASIAGPALAYWLNHYGFHVTVVERAPAPRPGGQAVDFKGAAHRTVLERMGVWTEIHEHRTGTTDTVFVDEAGERVGFMSGDFTGGDVEILRGDLAEILYKRTLGECEYLFGDSISALTETAGGVHVRFERGAPRTFDLVFGADGIHSRVRRLAFGPESEFVEDLGHYYCVAGASPWSTEHTGPRERATAYAFNAPGRLAVSGGPKAQQLYMFAAPELDYDRNDSAAQRRIIEQTYAGLGWEVPRMLAELTEFDDFYLDSLSQVRMRGYTKGRIALVGDSAYGNTLGGFGTGLAVVGAYVLAGELALADGEHTAAFARYDEIMRRYAKIASNSHAGKFLAPRTARGIKLRNWFLGSRMFALMSKFGDNAANDIDLRNYPELTTR
ncbi:FAD-dependent monooxygenase [Nocardia goodfellowii]|uniref:2-polyprenyl-6-methoxyphenol hydroxylase-like FAD-dependent oxidoreductase n=1 Tax=Nocardia goodfellowii TaxID=882446 RepID=A0ABS4QBX3_9NOCA|nr:FAD-dependent monooxygenase [Nocardia goodfellowii]MBP2189195.1 2-polyprenyl-6-methoxyphenol hydroxylase-like FAD-dependent oxidoreductase [Nocardia goodfellowii]